jgi:hypothetical protein
MAANHTDFYECNLITGWTDLYFVKPSSQRCSKIVSIMIDKTFFFDINFIF